MPDFDEKIPPTVQRTIQIGVVHAVNEAERKARVKFPNTEIISDWLIVLGHPYSWLPEVDDTVLCLFPPIRNSGGFIAGRIDDGRIYGGGGEE